MDQAYTLVTAGVDFHIEVPLVPFLVWCISGSRFPSLFLLELGAAIKVASTIVP